ncbi:MAG: hypothetical protein HN712_20350 [Gemmatimonadetes bacterium]|jgi:hypothetical protein|nr:hypothetical protein [Gemmatimonadota bacterium]MBT7862678.1 hypothetical protein [Gemmatimonadota bacterium]
MISGKTLARLRRLHLYLGVALAPLVLFFALTGMWQTLHLHENSKDGSYQAPRVLSVLSDVHEHQRAGNDAGRSSAFAAIVVLTSLGLMATTILGILMAFRFAQQTSLVWILLTAGVVIPLFLLGSGQW